MSDRPTPGDRTGYETASCTLSEADERSRVAWVREHVVPHYRGGELVANGFRATFDASAESLVALARLVDKESACCASFTFELVYEPPYDDVGLRITGPDGTRDLLQRGFLDEFDPAH
jgi:hypothetical protein